MQIIERKLEELIPYENNPRNNDEAVDAVAESIKEFGFKIPIILDKDDVIVAGHTRLKAAKKLGLKTVPTITADDLTPEQIKAFRLADNRSAEIATWNADLLKAELKGIDDIDMTIFGFTQEELTAEEQEEREKMEARESLNDRFVVPPLSILDTRAGYWVTRKQAWKKLIQDTGEARSNADGLKSMTKFANRVGASKIPKEYEENGASLLDPVLCEVINTWFMPAGGGKAFDCFAGDTAFGFVTSYMGNSYSGVELRQEQVDANLKSLANEGLKVNYFCDDGRNVRDHIPDDSQDLFFSCPPYYDLEVYSDKENDASNQPTYEEFYKILDTAFTESAKCLKNNRFAVVVAGDVRNKKNGGYYDFITDIKGTFRRNGFLLYDQLVLLRQVGAAALFATKTMETRKVRSIHEDVLVFYKGDPEEIKEEYGSYFLDDRQNIPAHEEVLVFYKGDDPKNIKKDFAPIPETTILPTDVEKSELEAMLNMEEF